MIHKTYILTRPLLYCDNMAETFKVGNVLIEVVKGDITRLRVDVIVNAANPYLKHGGGVAGAIVLKGGPEIQRESDAYVIRYGPVPVGGVAVTGAGKLRAKYIVHAVGPEYGTPDGDEKLYSAIANALKKADELGAKTVALPAISTGAYGYPYRRCAEIMVKVFKDLLDKLSNVEKIIVCLYRDEAYRVFLKVFREKLGGKR